MIADSKGPSVGLPPLALIPAVPVGGGAAAPEPAVPENTSVPTLTPQTTLVNGALVDVDLGEWDNVAVGLVGNLREFGSGDIVATFTEDGTYEIEPAVVGERLYLEVIPDELDEYAAYSTVTAIVGLSAITNATPADEAVSSTLNPVFTWDALAGATDELHLYYDATGLDEVALDNNTGLTGGTYTADPTSGTKIPPRENHPYYWQVTRTLNGQSVETALRELRIGIASFEDVRVYWKMDEASGTEFASQIAGVAALTPVNVVFDADAAGPNDGSLDFIDGSPAPYWDGTAYASYASAINAIGGTLSYTQFTWVFWVRIEAGVWTDATQRYLWNENSGGTTRQLELRRLTTNNNLFWAATMGGVSKTATLSAVNDTDWRPCVVVIDDAGDRADIYIEDMVTPKSTLTETGTSSSTAWAATRNLFGGFTTSDTNFAKMYMRNAARINHALTEAERLLLAAAFAAYSPPAAPEIAAPTAEQELADSTETVSWNDTGATDYDVEVSLDGLIDVDGRFTNPIETQAAVAATTTDLSALPDYNGYYVLVVDNDTGLISDVVHFYYVYDGFDQALGSELLDNAPSGFAFTDGDVDWWTDNEGAPAYEVTEVDSGEAHGGALTTGTAANFYKGATGSAPNLQRSSLLSSGTLYEGELDISYIDNPENGYARLVGGLIPTGIGFVDATEVGEFIGIEKNLPPTNPDRCYLGMKGENASTANFTADRASLMALTPNTKLTAVDDAITGAFGVTLGSVKVGESFWLDVNEDAGGDCIRIIAIRLGASQWYIAIGDIQSDAFTVRCDEIVSGDVTDLRINTSGSIRTGSYYIDADDWYDLESFSVDLNTTDTGIRPGYSKNLTPVRLRVEAI